MTPAEPLIRAFLAIDLPAEIKQSIEIIIQQLQKQYRNHRIRWVKSDNLHLTLQFIKELKTQDIDALVEQIKIRIADVRAFNIQLGAVELFPNPYHPTVISLEVKPTDPLTQLVNMLKESLSAIGYSIERRPFRGHITLGRIVFKAKKHLPPDIQQPIIPEIPVKEIILFRSELTSLGPHYVVLHHLALKNECSLD
jgi:2'-5' RNA ligase